MTSRQVGACWPVLPTIPLLTVTTISLFITMGIPALQHALKDTLYNVIQNCTQGDIDSQALSQATNGNVRPVNIGKTKSWRCNSSLRLCHQVPSRQGTRPPPGAQKVDTCRSHSSNPSTFTPACPRPWPTGAQPRDRRWGIPQTSNRTVPSTCSFSSWDHHPYKAFPSSTFTGWISHYSFLHFKKNSLLNGSFLLVNRKSEKNTKSLGGCLPAKKSPNTGCDDSKGI